jgi:hypothetical protein
MTKLLIVADEPEVVIPIKKPVPAEAGSGYPGKKTMVIKFINLTKVDNQLTFFLSLPT